MTKTYSIGEVAKQFNLTVSTIRYYDKENLIPNLKKGTTGMRVFTQENVDTINIIECLKKSNMSIKDIKIFIQWCKTGDTTLQQRLEMFQNLRQSVQAKMNELEKTLDTIEYKCNYYTQAVADGTESYVKAKQYS